jgi:hypothetical protein
VVYLSVPQGRNTNASAPISKKLSNNNLPSATGDGDPADRRPEQVFFRYTLITGSRRRSRTLPGRATSGHGTYGFLIASGFAISRACSMKSCATGLSVVLQGDYAEWDAYRSSAATIQCSEPSSRPATAMPRVLDVRRKFRRLECLERLPVAVRVAFVPERNHEKQRIERRGGRVIVHRRHLGASRGAVQ